MSSSDVFVARARALAERAEVTVLSLDVFDTLLWRVVPEPADAFVLVGRCLREAGHLQLSAEAFALLRAAAEERARARGVRERSTPEVSLVEIYDEMPPHVVGGAPAAVLSELELQVERSITFPDLAVLELATALQRSRNLRVVLISNTYFSATQVRWLLDRKPFLSLRLDGVFVSSESRRHKGSGLYRVVLDDLGVPASQVVHLGDDLDADITRPGDVGIQGTLLPSRPEPLPAILEREGMVRAQAGGRRRTSLGLPGHDFGLAALRAKALRRADGSTGGTRERTCWVTGAAVLGPVFTGFAEWVHDRGAEAGAARVFCLMREGAFLAPLLQSARRHRPVGVEAGTLWVSRYVCTQAAVVTGAADEIEMFLHRRQAPTLAAACEGLGLSIQQLPELAAFAGDRLEDPALRTRFVRRVSGDADLRTAVAAHCGEARRRLVEHLVRQVGADAGEVVLVDIGWGASIQAALERALRAEGSRLRTRGLYLLTNDAAVSRVLDGVAAEGFLGDLGLPEPAVPWIVRSPEVLEQLCMPDLGSLRGFDEHGRPVTSAQGADPRQHAERQAVQRGILAFQDEWARYRGVVGPEHQSLTGAARPLLLTTLLRFVTEPTTQEATVFGSWSHDENSGSQASDRLLDGMAGNRLEYLSPLQLLDLPMSRLYWPFGLAALHNPSLARAASAVASGDLPAQVFTSGRDTYATLYVDYGVGLLPRRQTVLRANSGGLYYLRQQVDAQPLRAVAIGFPPGPGLVRLDWMRLRFGVHGRPDQVVDVGWPQGDARLGYSDGEMLSGNLLHGRRRRPRLSFRCPPEWGREVYRVEVELGFAWMASSPGSAPVRDRAALALALARRARPRTREALDLARSVADRLRHR